MYSSNHLANMGRPEAVQEQSKMAVIRDKIRFSFWRRALAVVSCGAGMLLVMLMVRKNRRATQ